MLVGMSSFQSGLKASFEKALELSPTCTLALDGLADCYLAMSKNREAERTYRQSLEIDRNDATTLNNLGVSLQRQNKIKEAALVFKSAVEIDPNLKVAKSNTKQAIERLLPSIGWPIAIFLAIKILKGVPSFGPIQTWFSLCWRLFRYFLWLHFFGDIEPNRFERNSFAKPLNLWTFTIRSRNMDSNPSMRATDGNSGETRMEGSVRKENEE